MSKRIPRRNAAVHLLLPGSRARVRCGAHTSGRDIPTTRLPSAVTCQGCAALGRRPPAPTSRAAQTADYVATTTLVAGQRRLILPCECAALLVAGVDHTCDPADRRARGLPLD